ncbi:UNVERIFIED_CONTAM: hypothetical protein FKN15_018705 [Acipenser sinensis]
MLPYALPHLSVLYNASAGADLTRVVVTWQRPDYRVVHSFYYGQDQLALQNETYRNRTQLFPEQLSVGNASLRLKQVRGEDEGWYTCAVTNQVESTMGDVQLIVAGNPDRHRIVLWVVSTVVGVATVIIAISLLFKLRRDASTPTDPTEQQNMPCPISMGFRGPSDV